MRPTTLADARKLGLLPSVTKIISIRDKPQLNSWKTEQACLAVLTSPRKEGEALDAFVHRILQEEKVHEQEAARAREVGLQIHDAIDNALSGNPWDHSLEHFVEPVVEWANTIGKVIWTERVLVGNGYAGRADALLEGKLGLYLTDFKTCSKLPTGDSYPEHKLQTSAYAEGLGYTGDTKLLTCNLYISTQKPGDLKVCVQDDNEWPITYRDGFLPLIWHWQWDNNYHPHKEGVAS